MSRVEYRIVLETFTRPGSNSCSLISIKRFLGIVPMSPTQPQLKSPAVSEELQSNSLAALYNQVLADRGIPAAKTSSVSANFLHMEVGRGCMVRDCPANALSARLVARTIKRGGFMVRGLSFDRKSVSVEIVLCESSVPPDLAVEQDFDNKGAVRNRSFSRSRTERQAARIGIEVSPSLTNQIDSSDGQRNEHCERQ